MTDHPAADADAEAQTYARPLRRWSLRSLRRHSLYRRFGWRWCYSPSLDMRDAFEGFGDRLDRALAEGRARADAALAEREERKWWHTGCVASVHIYDEDDDKPTVTRCPDNPELSFPSFLALSTATILADHADDQIVMFVPDEEWCCCCGGHHVFGETCPPADTPEPVLLGIFGHPGIERTDQ